MPICWTTRGPIIKAICPACRWSNSNMTPTTFSNSLRAYRWLPWRQAWVKTLIALALAITDDNMDANTSPAPLAQAPSASSQAAPQSLHLVFPADGEEGEATRVRYRLTEDTLIVTYEVTTRDINPEKISE